MTIYPASVLPTSDFQIRQVRRSDSQTLIALIDSVYREYGDKICLEKFDADLLCVPDVYHEQGGEMVVAELDNGPIAGVHAALPINKQLGVFTFRRLYVLPKYRGTTGIGHALMQWAIDYSKKADASRIEFWSDTRFQRAHRFFEKFGFSRTGEIRHCDDSWEPYSEHFFFLNLK
jgi:putative acetyltransferase